MTIRLISVSFDANEPLRLAKFWAHVLNWTVVDEVSDETTVAPTDGTPFNLIFRPASEPKKVKNRIHFDLSSTSTEALNATLRRAFDLGGHHIDIGQDPTENPYVLADPEGNELCVLEPGGSFVEYSSILGSITCDGSRDVGYFWKEAFDWPLVWDQDEETAIRAPSGKGQFITWGPPIPAKMGKNRLRFDVASPEGSDQRAEVERLVSLGARQIDMREGDGIFLADPDDNEFCLLTAR